MSSNDLYNKLMGKYSGSSGSNSQNESKSNSSGHKKTYQSLIDKYDPDVNEDYVNRFIEDANSFLESAARDYSLVGYTTGSSIYESWKKTADDLSSRSSHIQQYMNKNKDSMDEEQYESWKNIVDEFDKASSLTMNSLFEAKTQYDDDRLKDYSSGSAKYGWQAYTSEKEKQQSEEEEKSWFEKAIAMIGGSSDSTLPGANITQVMDSYSKDTSYKEPTDQWNDDLRNAFGYLYSKDPEEAGKFAEEINNQLNAQEKEEQKKKVQESATDSLWGVATHTAGALLTAPLGLADHLSDIAEYNARGTITEKAGMTPFEYSQAVTSGVSEHLNEEYGTLNEDIPVIGGKGLGDAYGLTTSIVQSAIAGKTVGQFGTLIQFFGSAAASGIDEAKQRGATDEQALIYGTLVGAAEGAAEMIGVDNLLNIGSSATMREVLVNVAKQGVAEGLEEGITSVLNNFADQLTMGDMSNFNVLVSDYMGKDWNEEEAKRQAWIDMAEDVVYDMLGGFVSGSVHAGYDTAKRTIIENEAYSEVYGSSAAELVQQGLESAEGSLSHELAVKYQEKLDGGGTLTGAELNRLVKANEQEFLAEDKASIKQAAENRLTELGEVENVSTLADILTKQATKQKLTRAEKITLSSSRYGERVSNELNPKNAGTGEYSNAWAGQIGTSRINTAAYNQELVDLANEMSGVDTSRTEQTPPGQVSQVKVNKAATKNKQPTQGNYELSKSGKTTYIPDDQEVSIKEIATIKDGRMTFKLDDGRVIDSKDVSYANNGEALVYETVANMGVNSAAANVLVNAYHPSSGVSAEVYAHGIREAYRYGQYSYPAQELARGPFSSMLTEQQRNTAYKLGQMFSGKQVAKAQATIKKSSQVTRKNAGKVHFDGNRNSLTERQSASLAAMEKVAEIMGVQIHVFESEMNERGQRVGANGWYDPKDSSIHLDLHAGTKGEDTMLFTASHELVHFIKQWSPAKFKTLANFLMKEYGQKGVSVEKLVQKQIVKAANSGRTISYETAYEEVIADSMETMLADGNVMEKLAKLKQQDKTLWQKIKDFISELAAKIRKVYEGLTPDSVEGRYVAEMKDAIERLQDLFADALYDASENYQASEQVLAQAGIAVNSETDSGSLLSVRDVLSDADRKKVAAALADRFGVTEKEAMEWLKAETSMASLILNPKYSAFLDYEADPNEVAIKQNSDYPQGTVDFSNICKKRREFTQVMNRVLRNFPNHVFAATDLAKIRTIMGQEGMTLPCGICYVEDRRQLDTIVAQDFINGLKLYREGSKTRPDGKPFNANQLKGLQLTDGDTYVPTIYELVTLEGRNSLKDKNPNMEAAWVRYNNARGMQSVRLLTNEAEYKRQILKYSPKTVQTKNDYGGLRIYSFSDMEMFHLIDIIQVLTDSAAVGLKVQGYTKVNEYAKAVKDTGEKLNRSLIPKGDLGYRIENGKVVLEYDPVEGIDIYSEDFFDSKDNPNVGNIVIGINATQIRAAMRSDFIDYIIPFHTGQSAEVLGEKGIAAWNNYKDAQSEIDIATGKKSKHQINIYTEVFQAAEAEGKPIQNKRDFVNKFLAVCKENGLQPRFSEFLNTDENGDYVYTEGYHKFLVDFKTFAQTEVGEYLPQMPVKPIFDDAYITGLLEAYVEEQKAKDAEVAAQMPKVIERITNEIIKPAEADRYAEAVEVSDANVKWSIRDEDPPKNTKVGYKAFFVKDGKLYPPMVANPSGAGTPVGVWLNADTGSPMRDKEGNIVQNQSGRAKVAAGGKGTKGGGGSLAWRPGWHLGPIPDATQFSVDPDSKEWSEWLNKTGKTAGESKNIGNKGTPIFLNPHIVFAEVEFAADVDYQLEAYEYGVKKNGKFDHSQAGIPYVIKDGYYRYRTNSMAPGALSWYITGSMKVNRILTDAECREICAKSGRDMMPRLGGDFDFASHSLAAGDVTPTEDLSSVAPKQDFSAGICQKGIELL